MKTSESVAKFMFLFHEKVKEKNALYIKQLIKNLIGIVINRMEDIIDKIEPFYRFDLMRVKKKTTSTIRCLFWNFFERFRGSDFMNEYFLFTLGYENWDKRRSSKQK